MDCVLLHPHSTAYCAGVKVAAQQPTGPRQAVGKSALAPSVPASAIAAPSAASTPEEAAFVSALVNAFLAAPAWPHDGPLATTPVASSARQSISC